RERGSAPSPRAESGRWPSGRSLSRGAVRFSFGRFAPCGFLSLFHENGDPCPNLFSAATGLWPGKIEGGPKKLLPLYRLVSAYVYLRKTKRDCCESWRRLASGSFRLG